MLTFLAGLMAGLVLSAPVGPMGAVAVYQTGAGQVRSARLLAVGVCVADGLLACLASFGMRIPIPDVYFNLAVVLMLAGLGGYLMVTADKPGAMPKASASVGVGFLSTLMNPGNLLAFASVFGWLHNNGMALDTLLARAALLVGVFAGALGMWLAMIELTARLWGRYDLDRFQSYLKQGIAVLCLVGAGWAALDMVHMTPRLF